MLKINKTTSTKAEVSRCIKIRTKTLYWDTIKNILLNKFIPCFITGCCCKKIENALDLGFIIGISLLISTLIDATQTK